MNRTEIKTTSCAIHNALYALYDDNNTNKINIAIDELNAALKSLN